MFKINFMKDLIFQFLLIYYLKIYNFNKILKMIKYYIYSSAQLSLNIDNFILWYWKQEARVNN